VREYDPRLLRALVERRARMAPWQAMVCGRRRRVSALPFRPATSIRRLCWRRFPIPSSSSTTAFHRLGQQCRGAFSRGERATLRECAADRSAARRQPAFNLVEAVRRSGSSIAEYSVPIETHGSVPTS